MTNPTGRSFLSYRRSRKDEASHLIAAQHDHGIPTWQDVQELGSVPAEDEIRRVLDDPSTASGVLFVTPEVEDSPIIRNVEVPNLLERAEAGDGFFVVPVASGGLDYARAAEVASNHLSARSLAEWNMHRVADAVLSASDAAAVAYRGLVQRIRAVHATLRPDAALRVGLYVRRPPPFELGNALTIDWSARFCEKEAPQETWSDTLLPALARVASVLRQHAPGREVVGFGIPTLPAALAFGCAFLSTSGIRLSWRQVTRGQPDQIWNLDAVPENSGFEFTIKSKVPEARDLAVLLSVTDDVEPLVAACSLLPPLRGLVHVTKPGRLPHILGRPGEATHLTAVVQDAMRSARRQYGNIGTIHLFMAAPAGMAVLVGQSLNTFGAVQTYEHVSSDGSGHYTRAALLRPCT